MQGARGVLRGGDEAGTGDDNGGEGEQEDELLAGRHQVSPRFRRRTGRTFRRPLSSMERSTSAAFEPAQLGCQLRDDEALGALIEDPRVDATRGHGGHSVSVPRRVPAWSAGAALSSRASRRVRSWCSAASRSADERRPRRIEAAARRNGGPRRHRRRELGAEAPQRAARLRPLWSRARSGPGSVAWRAEVRAEDFDAQPAPRMRALAALELLHQVRRGCATRPSGWRWTRP